MTEKEKVERERAEKKARQWAEKELETMKETKHTPGPWGARVLKFKDHASVTIYAENGFQVGSCTCSHKLAKLENLQQAEANAALIAAAPETAAERDRLKEINAELLQALEKIARGLPSREGLGGHAPLVFLGNTARAAIAKAKGKINK